MTNAYSWHISALECYPEHDGKPDVVFNIHWRRQATDGNGHHADIYGCERVSLDPSAPFTPYANLTQAQVIGWLESAFGPEKLASQIEVLDRQISEQVNPPSVNKPIPWANA